MEGGRVRGREEGEIEGGGGGRVRGEGEGRVEGWRRGRGGVRGRVMQ